MKISYSCMAAVALLSIIKAEVNLDTSTFDECSTEGCALSALQMRASHAESDAVLMNHSESRKCRDFRVTGKVQMVHYRNWAVGRARKYGVKGWVANGGDSSLDGSHSPCPTCGCVLGHVEGPASAVDRFVREMCRGGPPHSYTKSCDVKSSDCFRCNSFYKENRFCKTWSVKDCKRRC